MSDRLRMVTMTGSETSRAGKLRDLRNHNEEPRGPPSAVGEVELPPRSTEPRAVRASANCKVTPKAPRQPAAPMRRRPPWCPMPAGATLARRRGRAPRRQAAKGHRRV